MCKPGEQDLLHRQQQPIAVQQEDQINLPPLFNFQEVLHPQQRQDPVMDLQQQQKHSPDLLDESHTNPPRIFDLRETLPQQHIERAPEQVLVQAQRQEENLAVLIPVTREMAQAQRQREKARLAALKLDEKRKKNDKVRHGFYDFIKKVINFFSFSSRKKERNQYGDNTQYRQSLQMAYDEILAMRLQAEDGGEEALAEFTEKHGAYFQDLERQVNALRAQTLARLQVQNADVTEAELERQTTQAMSEVQVTSQFQGRQASNVVGGTKPNSTMFHQTGSRWLVKEAVSCIGIKEPFSAHVTEAGYKIQKLVNPDTAIEAFRGHSAGLGLVSYQRMVNGVKNDDVDLFRFSRTPESMTDQELARIQELSPQFLREHTTDWLLCNYDTKGENFLIANDGTGPDRVYGIDKEAAFRRILAPGAQKMSKDYKGFDQDTVYNRLFQLFSQGKMDLDLQAVLPQIQRVEAMSDEQYMATFAPFLKEKAQTDPEHVDEIRANILRRKMGLRLEYRTFFTDLVNQRAKQCTPGEAKALRRKYFGAEDGGVFLFTAETAQDLARDQLTRDRLRALDQDKLEQAVQKAEQKDEKKYKQRHAFYDFSKSVVLATKSVSRKVADQEVKMATQIRLSDVRLNENADPVFRQYVERNIDLLRSQAKLEIRQQAGLRFEQPLSEDQQMLVERLLAEKMSNFTVELKMDRQHDVHLGGTKPMSEHFAADGTRWLTKQAVNCMGYAKPDGALLTEAGAKLQKIIHPQTAVEAFVGKTKSLGDVSFQRRLDNVEGGHNKLDLFKFSKHPELASRQTIQEVEALAPQILREHTTDWLLCNFDTKGENFIITKKEGEERVLHGIDKEAAFNKILKPGAQHMSTTYRPHANETLYNVIYGMYAKNEMNFDLNAVLPQIQKIEQMDDDAYIALYEDYFAEIQKKKKPEEVQEIRKKILQRKQLLRQEYCDFFTGLVNQRCKHLHPEESAALKARYFQDDRFQFPN